MTDGPGHRTRSQWTAQVFFFWEGLREAARRFDGLFNGAGVKLPTGC